LTPAIANDAALKKFADKLQDTDIVRRPDAGDPD
jgi:hypothetical protein